jgi:large subunit ribosomal protein L18e
MKSNPNLSELIIELKRLSRENKAPIWREVANRLEKPSRTWAEVNVSDIEKHAKPKEILVVPGKLLGVGILTKPVSIAAYSASAGAIKKVELAGGKFIHISAIAQANPKGSGLRLMG